MDEFNMARPEGDLPHPCNPPARWIASIRKWRVTLAAIAITATLLWLIAVSPVFLRQIGQSKGTDWTKLGNIGQAYGGASAVLAGIALVGIAGSLIIQVRQARTERIRLVRERHHELLRVVMDNPKVYAPVMGTGTPNTVDEVRQSLFATMLMNYTLTGYEMGVITQQTLSQEILPSAFASGSFRMWWSAAEKYWTPRRDMTRRERQFSRLLNDQYNKAVASGSPIQRTIGDSASGVQNATSIPGWAIPVSMAVGVSIGAILRSTVRVIRAAAPR
jgi:hypothetical protein